ncbi:hypothetical protein ACIPEP_17320 [Curtobacterium sp. NPDC087082]|uniref:hypothetical protein n=1 Tax=Curtobacterium sp. NPDC087082 TaxID=3363966 RepID=UPI00380072D4
MRRAVTRGRTTAVVLLAAVAAIGLTGCSVFSGPDPVPSPTRLAVQGPDATELPTPSASPTPEQVLPAGTVAAETDVVSKTGDTSIHVRVTADAGGVFTVHLSDYRTTNPQPMSIQFRHRVAGFQDGYDAVARGFVQWDRASGPPDSYTLDAGARPDYLASAVLVPMSSDDGSSDADRPWVGSVLAVGTLTWKIPNPYPDLRVTVGKARPGAYGYVKDVDGTPTWYMVSHGDDLTTVSKRFGVTPAQFEWMNPYLELRGDKWLNEDATLNISPANR